MNYYLHFYYLSKGYKRKFFGQSPFSRGYGIQYNAVSTPKGALLCMLLPMTIIKLLTKALSLGILV